VQLVFKVFKVLLEQLVLQVHKVHRGLQVLPDQQVLREFRVLRVLLALQVKEHKVLLV
jgi:hypothetical protein